MPRVKLTDRKLKSLKPATSRTDYFDVGLPGFCVRVTPKGVKSYAVMYRHAGRLRRYTIGRWPRLTLAEARDLGREALHEASLGRDPANTKKLDRQAITFATLAEEYMERWAKVRKRSWRHDRQMLEKDLLPVFRNVKASEISRADVRALLDRIVSDRPIKANRVHSLLRKIYNWGMDQDLVDHNPCASLTAPAPSRQRERVLTESELQKLWKATDSLRPDFRDVFRLCLLTAQRSGAEVLRMRWQDLDLETGWWTIPGEFTKNKLTHRVSLNRQALRIIEAIRESQTGRSRPAWVFPSRRDRRQPLTNLTGYFSKARDKAGLKDVTLHDLRRTAASMMTGMGVPRLTVSKILNHVETGVTKIYDRHSYDQEKREALEKWGRKLVSIVSSLRATETS